MAQVKFCFVIIFGLLLNFSAFAQNSMLNSSDEVENNFYEALTQHATENYDKAIFLLKKNIQQQPNQAVFYHQLGKCYFALKDYQHAENAFRKAIELDTSQKWYWIDLYKLFYTTKDFRKAIPVATKVAELDKQYQDDLVSLYIYAKQYDKALNLIVEIEKQGKLSLAIEQFKFQALSEIKFSKKIEADFKNAITSDSINKEAYIAVINNFIEENKFDKAYRIIDELTVRVPNTDWAFVNKYRLALKNNKYTEAHDFLTALINSSEISELMKHRSFNEFLIYVNVNENHIDDLEDFVDYFTDQDLVNVAKEVGIFFYNKNKIDLAQFYLKKGIEKNRNDSNAIALYIQTYIDIKNLIKAEEISKYYLKLFPTEPKLYFYLGLCQKALNEPKKALKTFNEALAYLSNDSQLEANIYIEIGECYYRLGNEKQKEAYFIKANQLLKNYDK